MLKNKTKTIVYSLLALLIIGVAYTFYFNDGQVKEINQLGEYEELFAMGTCNSHNMYGWAYSPVIGPISLNCANCDKDGDGLVDADCGGTGNDIYDYGVGIDVNGNLFGYAWSAAVGPISFNNDEICTSDTCVEADFPVADHDSAFSAKVVWYSAGKAKINGWARALSACEFNGTRCETNEDGDNAGGWDGWIKFDGDGTVDYDTCSEGICGGTAAYNTIIETVGDEHLILGNAWGGVLSDDAVPDAVMGEIIFLDGAKTDYDPDNACAAEEPVAAFYAVCVNGNITTGNCFYDPDEEVPLFNDSVDPDTANCGLGENIETSNWASDGSSLSACSSSGKTNCTLDLSSYSEPVTKVIDLEVIDFQTNTNSITHSIDFKEAISADFSCCTATDTIDCSLDSHFQDCDYYKTRTMMEGKVMYLKDHIDVPKYSIASEGTSIVSRAWQYDNGDVTVTEDLNALCEIQVTDDGIVQMTVTDGLGWSDIKALDFSEFGNIISNPEFVEK